MADVTDTWSSSELDPYRQLIGEGAVDAVMTAHVYHRDLDPDHPATLSKSIIGDLLRDQLHFKGVVVSDDMQMGAVANFYGLEEAPVWRLRQVSTSLRWPTIRCMSEILHRAPYRLLLAWSKMDGFPANA